MKIRKLKKKTWMFFPRKSSSLPKMSYSFKYKKDLMNFLSSNFSECHSGKVTIWHQSPNYSYYGDIFQVWHTNGYVTLHRLRRGFKKCKTTKKSKRWFAFSKKVLNRMNLVENEDGTINKPIARNLVELFYKRGFKDDIELKNGEMKHYLKEGIPFHYWSDRCNFTRCKIIIEYFKLKNVL